MASTSRGIAELVMAEWERPLQTAKRLVVEQEQRITRQLELMGELAAAGSSTEVAKDTLILMERMLTVLRLDRDRLEDGRDATESSN